MRRVWRVLCLSGAAPVGAFPSPPHVARPNASTSSARPATELFHPDCNPSGTVVLTHGWPLSWRMWEPQIGPLTEAGYRVACCDRRGFSSPGFPRGDYDTFAADPKDLLEELDPSDATRADRANALPLDFLSS